MRIITNHVPRLIIDGYELTDAERAELDYIDWTAVDDGRESASFVRYRGRLYDLSEAMRSTDPALTAEWDGYWGETFFSSVLVRYCRDDSDRVVIGYAVA
jgi:hypothetical protein